MLQLVVTLTMLLMQALEPLVCVITAESQAFVTCQMNGHESGRFCANLHCHKITMSYWQHSFTGQALRSMQHLTLSSLSASQTTNSLLEQQAAVA